jgi:hypothetical protein
MFGDPCMSIVIWGGLAIDYFHNQEISYRRRQLMLLKPEIKSCMISGIWVSFEKDNRTRVATDQFDSRGQVECLVYTFESELLMSAAIQLTDEEHPNFNRRIVQVQTVENRTVEAYLHCKPPAYRFVDRYAVHVHWENRELTYFFTYGPFCAREDLLSYFGVEVLGKPYPSELPHFKITVKANPLGMMYLTPQDDVSIFGVLYKIEKKSLDIIDGLMGYNPDIMIKEMLPVYIQTQTNIPIGAWCYYLRETATNVMLPFSFGHLQHNKQEKKPVTDHWKSKLYRYFENVQKQSITCLIQNDFDVMVNDIYYRQSAPCKIKFVQEDIAQEWNKWEEEKTVQVCTWIETVIDEKIDHNILKVLDDGKLLCKLSNAISSKSVLHISDNAKTNIDQFLEAAGNMGLSSQDAFSIKDLHKRSPLVIHTLFVLGSIVTRNPETIDRVPRLCLTEFDKQLQLRNLE